MKVVVVGAGLGGLSAAAHLLGDGHDVTVVERGARPGGRAGLLEAGGYRLDTGPTVLTMPDLLAATFRAAGAELADFVTLSRVEPTYRAVFADASELRVWPERDRMTAEIAAVCGEHDAEAFGPFCDWLGRLYRLEMDHFIDTNVDSPVDLLRPLAPALQLLRMGGLRRLQRVVSSTFDDERVRRVLSFQSLYAGLAPQQALALFAVITYMDTVGGVYFPQGGMHAVATGLAAAVEQAGAAVRCDAPVAAILRASGTTGRVTGVDLEDGERLAADAVVCNADLPVAYRTLLRSDPPRVARRGAYSPSCLLWVAGVRGTPAPGAAHHNLHFGQAWDSSFASLVRDGALMEDPSILVTLPTLVDPGLAPPGCSSLYVLEPVPNLDGRVDWTRARDRRLDDLRARVVALGYPVEVEVEEVVDPLDWERLGLERGTPFSLAHRFFQSGPFRPGNVDRRVPGLVFVGSSTVPGVGVPMVLVSGRLAAERVRQLAGASR
jgi:phytoene desaturase